MSHRQFYIAIAGLALGLIGLAALGLPVYLDQLDPYGIKVNCGNGIISDLGQAHNANSDALASRCETAVLVRRSWAIPTVAVGFGLVAWFLVLWVREERLELEDHYVPHPEISSNA